MSPPRVKKEKKKKSSTKICEDFELRAVKGWGNLVACRSRKTLQNEYLDAKIGVDTAENEPSEV